MNTKYKVINADAGSQFLLPDTLEDQLNRLAKQGWELVSVLDERLILATEGGIDLDVIQHTHCEECGFVVAVGAECDVCKETKT